MSTKAIPMVFRVDARKRHWERHPFCAEEDWLHVRYTPEGEKRRANAKRKLSGKKTTELKVGGE
jgi:hypothetical protein